MIFSNVSRLTVKGDLCFICKTREDNVGHFLLECRAFRDDFESIWSNLRQKIISTNPVDRVQISDFISNFDNCRKSSYYCGGGGGGLSFNDRTITLIYRLICVAVGKLLQKKWYMIWRHPGSPDKTLLLCPANSLLTDTRQTPQQDGHFS